MEGKGDSCSTCVNCKQAFSVTSLSPLKGRIPLILPCNHFTCYVCLKEKCNKTHSFECNVCKVLHNISPSDNKNPNDESWALNVLPVNHYILGMLTRQRSSQAAILSFNPQFRARVEINLPTPGNTEQCSACNECTADIRCKQCEAFLCNECFTKIHGVFAPLQKHEKEPIVSNNLMELLTVCPVHADKNFEFFCEDCNKYICFSCMFTGSSCSKHKVKTVVERNNEVLKDLTTKRDELDELLRRMNTLLLDLSSDPNAAKSNTSSKAASAMRELTNHFAELHAAIQLHENQLKKSLVDSMYSDQNELQKLKADTFKNIFHIEETLTLIDYAIKEDNLKKINCISLIDKVDEALSLPWYLQKEVSSPDTKSETSVSIDKEIFEKIKDHVSVSAIENSKYKLLSSIEIPEGVEIPPAPATLVETEYTVAKDHRRQNALKPPTELTKKVFPAFSNSSANSAASDVSSGYDLRPAPFQVQRKFREQKGQKGKDKRLNPVFSDLTANNVRNHGAGYNYIRSSFDFSPRNHQNQRNTIQQKTVSDMKPLIVGSIEQVIVAKVSTPHSFYIHRQCANDKLNEMFLTFRSAASWPIPSLENLMNGLVLAYHNNSWYRGKVLKREEDKITVYHVDMGNVETITIDKLRIMPDSFLDTQWQAIKCRLFKCEPIQGKWTYESSVLMERIINKKPVLLEVVGIRQPKSQNDDASNDEPGVPVLEVNLAVCEDIKDYAVDIADALCYARHANMTHRNTLYTKSNFTNLMYGNHTRASFYPAYALPEKQVTNVRISHVESPEKFYVRKANNEIDFIKLQEEINKQYDNADDSVIGVVYTPQTDMCVAVNVAMSADSYLDCVNVRNKTGSWYRGKIFASLPDQVVRIFLVDTGHVVSVHCYAVRRLTPNFMRMNMMATECTLQDLIPAINKWSLEATEFLRSFSSYELKLWSVKKQPKQNYNHVILYNTDDSQINVKFIEKGYAIKTGDIIDNCKISVLPSPIYENAQRQEKKMVVVTNKKNKISRDGVERLAVTIALIKSPSEIYVSLLGQEDTAKEFTKDLNDFYENSEPNDNLVWTENEICAVLHSKLGWCRAIISKVHPDHSTEVFLTDHALNVAVPYASMRVLNEEFRVMKNGVIKCHLTGVMKASEGDWPTLTCEYLNELSENFDKIYISKGESSDEESWPIEMWAIEINEGDAVEATKRKWIKLNDKLVEQGLALPTNKNKKNIFEGLGQGSQMLDEWLLIYNNSMDKEGTSTTAPRLFTDWLPPKPLTKKKLNAIPTYVDHDLSIYLHDVESRETLLFIKFELNSKFKDTEPTEKDMYWSAGQPCIAEFNVDKSFYRARILEILDDNKVNVLFVDYGNEEICDMKSVRKAALLYDTPIQCWRCYMTGIKPISGKYSQTVTDMLHKLIVEKEVQVSVKDITNEDYIPITLKLNDLDISYMLLSIELVAVDGENSTNFRRELISPSLEECNANSEPDIIEGEESSSDEEVARLGQTPFVIADEPESSNWVEIMELERKRDLAKNCKYINIALQEGFEFTCSVQGIIDSTTYCLHVNSDDLENVMQDIQDKAAGQPRIDLTYEFKPCIALYDIDEKWYRAEILNYDNIKKVFKVIFVDYGNVGVVSRHEAKETSPDWCKLPPRAISGQLNNIVTTKTGSEEEVVDLLLKSILNSDLKGIIISKTKQSASQQLLESYIVELYDKDINEPAYQSLIDQNYYICETK